MIELLQQKIGIIMIIDDNNIDRYIGSRLIIKNNFANKLLQYDNAVNALHYLQDNQNNIDLLPNIIFLDIYMPMMSGFEFMEAFNTLPQFVKKYCKVFIISSTIDDSDISRVHVDPNIFGFLEKPITKEFLEKITTI
ncbi:response regulator [Flavobacterium luteum]|uniref:Response regulator n=1 Tax=Flavobacterium luteum TaxID=2026654 RepID=A0A7J5ABU5_9FLAO|nr:response regulator [Flavobacterium luteum]KAB1155052.1 response regulator [Flavobacterium luteum]